MHRQPNKENIRLLVEALRSGEYTQATGSLARAIGREVVGHCCLGVACEVAMNHGVEMRRETVGITVFYDNEGSVLPTKVADFFGFTANPDISTITDTKFYVSAAEHNDRGHTFDEIADLFEKHYLRETDTSTTTHHNQEPDDTTTSPDAE